MRFLYLLLAGCLVQTALAQPTTLTLRAKLRDFKEFSPTDPFSHPDFENDSFMGCGGENLGYVEPQLAVDGLVDTAVFKGDQRGPVLQKLKHPSSGTPCFTGVERFRDWYNDNPAYNRSFYIDLVLTRDDQGVYTFNDDAFLPLNPGGAYRKFNPTDPEPFGPLPKINPVNVWGFTMELHTEFTYTAGKGQRFAFKGDDDVWVFINGKLVIDLGGLHHSWYTDVNLDNKAAALGLIDGESYPLDFFFAERHSVESHCQITTTLKLVQKGVLPTPVATPAGQTYRKSLQVALAVPDHPEAQIRYTLDGTEPDSSSPLYASPFNLTADAVIKAKGFLEEYLPSKTLTETYVREFVALPTPVATPPGQVFRKSLQVALALPGHPEAQIRYTLDGSEPDSTSPVYATPFNLTADAVIKAKGFLADYLPSQTLTETYVREFVALPTPVANPRGGNFQGTLAVTLTLPPVSTESPAVIRYTLDGSEPTLNSPVYTAPLVFSDTAVLKAKAFAAEWLPSLTLSETYVWYPPPNVIGLKLTRPVGKSEGLSQVLSLPELSRPITVVSVDRGAPRCLACPIGADPIVLGAGEFPEWTTSSKDPFHYEFHIYDNIGSFVVSQKGYVSREMLDQVPGDSAGYRILRFRWIPVSHAGRAVGTGAYILRGLVVADKPKTPFLNGSKSESAIIKRFGYLRKSLTTEGLK